MIGLLQVDGKWPNLALMHLSTWFRAQGEQVSHIGYIEQEGCRQVYASKVFSFSRCDSLREDAIRGGTGWPDWRELAPLPPEAEHCYPDYESFGCDYAMGYLTRGCIRRCPFCLVYEKEGMIHHHASLSEWWHGQDRIRLLDANLTAHTDILDYLHELMRSGAQVDFSQGLDARLVTEEMCGVLRFVRRWGRYHSAWDNPAEEYQILRGLRLLRDMVSQHDLMVYVLIGFNTSPEEDLYRVQKLREERIDAFVMPYDRADSYQRRFARWVNHKGIFKSVPWTEYAAPEAARKEET
jgi:hypothetical protein